MIIFSREGFRSRLENIVRDQASSNSDATSNSDDANGSISDGAQTNASDEVRSENSELSPPRAQVIDTGGLPDQTRNSISDISVEEDDQRETTNQEGNWEGQDIGRRRNWQESDEAHFNDWRGSNAEVMDGNWQGSSGNGGPDESLEDVVGEQGLLQEAQGVWHEAGTREAVGNWAERPSDLQRTRRTFPVRRYNRFHPPDDDNVYSMELRELLSRYLINAIDVLCMFHCIVQS